MVLQNYPALWCAVFIILDDRIEKRRSFMLLPYHSFVLSCLIKVNTICNTKHNRHGLNDYTILAGLAQSVEHLTDEWEIVGLIPGAGPAVLRVLK